MFYKPPTIQEMPRVNPDDHMPLIYDTAMDMVSMNMPYTGKNISGVAYDVMLFVNVNGIRNSMERGTAILNKKETEILFFHPGTGEYVPYDKELQKFLLGFISGFKSAYQGDKEYVGNRTK